MIKLNSNRKPCKKNPDTQIVIPDILWDNPVIDLTIYPETGDIADTEMENISNTESGDSSFLSLNNEETFTNFTG